MQRTAILAVALGCGLLWLRPALALQDERDRTALFSALNDLMGFAAPGRSVDWENPETGNSGRVTVLRPGSVPGRICWDFARTYEDDGWKSVEGTACQLEPGLWEVVREGAPQAVAAEAPQPTPGVARAEPPSPSVVREAQSLLARLNYAPGPADGILGRRTRQAITAYQRDRGLAESGQLTEETLTSLRQDVAALQPPAELESDAEPASEPGITAAPPQDGESGPGDIPASEGEQFLEPEPPDGDMESPSDDAPETVPTPPPPPPPPAE